MTELRTWIDNIAALYDADEPSVGDTVFLEWGTDWLVETEIV